jgi:hypothetical protein
MRQILIFTFLLFSSATFSQYSSQYVDIYKMDATDKMKKLATKNLPMEVTINEQNIYILDKTSGQREVYNVTERATENGRKVTYAKSTKTKLLYKFTVIDNKVSTFYDYDESTEMFRSALMFYN